MRARIRLLAVAGFIGVLVAGGCSRPHRPPHTTTTRPPDPPPARLDGVNWVLDPEVLGTPPPGSPPTINASFSGPGATGTVSGSSGCNHYSGTYVRSGDRLTISDLAGTDMACEPNVMRWEQAYLSRLQLTAGLRLSARALTLLDAQGATLLRFRPAAPPPPVAPAPAGNWTATEYRSANGLVPVDPPGAASFALDGSGRLSGRACNIFGGTYRVDGDAITLRAEWMTEMACAEPGPADLDAYFVTALSSAARWRSDGATLELLDAAGAPVVRAQRALPPKLPPGGDSPDTPVSSPGT